MKIVRELYICSVMEAKRFSVRLENKYYRRGYINGIKELFDSVYVGPETSTFIKRKT